MQETVLEYWLVASLAVVICWALMTRMGWQTLARRPVRRHYLQLPTIFLVLGAFLVLATVLATVFARAGLIVSQKGGAPPDLKVSNDFWIMLANIAAELGAIAILLPLANQTFVGGLKTFGLSRQKLCRNILLGVAYLAIALPLVMYVLAVTQHVFHHFGRETPAHDLLNVVQHTGFSAMQVAALLMGAVAAPIAEELFFRGLIQNFLLRFFHDLLPPRGRPEMALWLNPPELRYAQARMELEQARARGDAWAQTAALPPDPGQLPLARGQEALRSMAALLLTALFFALVHSRVPYSVPPIFILALALGYAYERTGSLVTPIVMHMGFNAMNMAMALLVRQPPTQPGMF